MLIPFPGVEAPSKLGLARVTIQVT